jgi:hypothetical protein
VVKKASLKALSGVAKVIGASITSGGTGKNDDSAKLSAHKYLSACLCLAQVKTLSYNFLNIETFA